MRWRNWQPGDCSEARKTAQPGRRRGLGWGDSQADCLIWPWERDHSETEAGPPQTHPVSLVLAGPNFQQAARPRRSLIAVWLLFLNEDMASPSPLLEPKVSCPFERPPLFRRSRDGQAVPSPPQSHLLAASSKGGPQPTAGVLRAPGAVS